jgi:hypothetical protein
MADEASGAAVDVAADFGELDVRGSADEAEVAHAPFIDH